MSQQIYFPVEIDKFIFHDRAFSEKGREYSYDDIASLKFQILRTSINFSTDETYYFGIRTHNNEMKIISIADASFSFNKTKVAEKKRKLLAIANHLNKLTFQRRFDTYLNQIRTTGCIEYTVPDGGVIGKKSNTIFIYSNGDVSIAGKTVNLIRARKAGTLFFGTDRGFGYDRSLDPFEVSINEKPPILGGKYENFGSVRFDAGWDFPMIFEILESIE